METRTNILAATAELLREKGPDGASARAICAAAGITAPTLYHHFGDLAGLYEAVVEHAFAESASRRRSRQHGKSALADLRTGWDSYVSFAEEEPALFALINRAVTSAGLPEVALQSYRALEENVRRLAGERSLACRPAVATQMLWAAAHGTACLVAAGHHGFQTSESLSRSLREATLEAILGD